jgi:hypothetical protein
MLGYENGQDPDISQDTGVQDRGMSEREDGGDSRPAHSLGGLCKMSGSIQVLFNSSSIQFKFVDAAALNCCCSGFLLNTTEKKKLQRFVTFRSAIARLIN